MGTAYVARFDFSTKKDEQIIVSTAISGVSMEGAAKNLQAEVPENDFEKYRLLAKETWNKELSKIKVESENKDDKTECSIRHFIIACWLPPFIRMSTEQSYGPDQKVHQAENWTNYSTFSLWDTFRASHPLFTYTQPERTNDMIKSFLAFYEQNGRLPVWNFYGSETDMMNWLPRSASYCGCVFEGYR